LPTDTRVMQTKLPREVAAIDLGSNSFHMVVAVIEKHSIRIISRHKQRVRLVSGLNEAQEMSEEVMLRGLDCLKMFAERIQGFAPENVKIKGTFTLRRAVNAQQFLARAKRILPYSIEIIPGIEEARLIYLGVAHTRPETGRKLVVDIGGGSTEVVIGEDFNPIYLNSKHMGCVSFAQQFFPDGFLSHHAFNEAVLAAERKLESISVAYRESGWENAFGASGTIKAVKEMVKAQGYDDGFITPKRLDKVIDSVLCFKSIDELKIDGVNPDRVPVIASGLAVLKGIFNALHIKLMKFSEGALREGVLYELEESFSAGGDIRTRTTKALAERYAVDLVHAIQVRKTARKLCYFAEQSHALSPKTRELESLLDWACMLHEVGLSINYSAFHRHSAYILGHSNLPGFSQEQQNILMAIVRFQRKSLKLKDMPVLTIYKHKHLIPCIKMMRLAAVLNVQRKKNNDFLDVMTLCVNKNENKDEEWILSFPEGYFAENKLLATDLQVEQSYWAHVGWQLTIKAQRKNLFLI